MCKSRISPPIMWGESDIRTISELADVVRQDPAVFDAIVMLDRSREAYIRACGVIENLCARDDVRPAEVIRILMESRYADDLLAEADSAYTDSADRVQFHEILESLRDDEDRQQGALSHDAIVAIVGQPDSHTIDAPSPIECYRDSQDDPADHRRIRCLSIGDDACLDPELRMSPDDGPDTWQLPDELDDPRISGSIIEAIVNDDDARSWMDLDEVRSEEVVRHLIERGMEPADLLGRIMESPHANTLLRVVAREYRDSDQMATLIDLLLELHADAWTEVFRPRTFCAIICSVGDFQALSDSPHRAVLADSDHPLFDRLDADLYWRRRIEHFRDRRDWERALDEIDRAARGIHRDKWARIAGEDRTPPGERRDAHYLFAVTARAARVIIRDLFNAMLDAGLVGPIKSADRLSLNGGRTEGGNVPAGYNAAVRLGFRNAQSSIRGRDVFDIHGARLLVMHKAMHVKRQILRSRSA